MVGALGTFRLVRSYDAPPAAAYVAAVAVPMGGMTQYLDLPSWAAAEMIWALLPWVWWALRRTMIRGANPLPALVLGYLLVSVGYVFGTIMLVIVLVACLLDSRLARDWAALRRVLVSGLLLGLVALTVYLPGVLTASVTARDEALPRVLRRQVHHRPARPARVGAAHGGGPERLAHLLPYAYVAWFLPAGGLAGLGPGAPGVAPAGRAAAVHAGDAGPRGRPGPGRAPAVAAPAPAVPGRGAGGAAGRRLAPLRAAARPRAVWPCRWPGSRSRDCWRSPGRRRCGRRTCAPSRWSPPGSRSSGGSSGTAGPAGSRRPPGS